MFRMVMATNNENKINEIKNHFWKYEVQILSLKEVQIESNPEESGTSFQENAFLKAKAVAQKTSLPVLSDDSGLIIDGLNGFPGIYSSRFMNGFSYEEKCLALWEKMKNVENKKASFQCVLCLLNFQKDPLYFQGIHKGEVVYPKGKNGFGYDPIFYSYELKKTFGEATAEEKNAFSHRGRALQALENYLLECHFSAK